MSDNHDVSKLDDLIITLIDSVKGYEHSAEKAEGARYKSETELEAQRAIRRALDPKRILNPRVLF